MNARDQWFVRHGANRVGPVTTELLLRGIREGKIPRDAEARRVEEQTWIPLMDVVVTLASAALHPDMVDLGDEARTIVRDFPVRPSASVVPRAPRSWYVRHTGSVVGPVTTEVLIKGIEAGRVPSTSRVCPEGEGAWVPIIAHPTFEKAFSATEPPPAPSTPRTVIIQPEEHPDFTLEPATELWVHPPTPAPAPTFAPAPFALAPPPAFAPPLTLPPASLEGAPPTVRVPRRAWLVVAVVVVGGLLLLVLLAGVLLLGRRVSVPYRSSLVRPDILG